MLDRFQRRLNLLAVGLNNVGYRILKSVIDVLLLKVQTSQSSAIGRVNLAGSLTQPALTVAVSRDRDSGRFASAIRYACQFPLLYPFQALGSCQLSAR